MPPARLKDSFPLTEKSTKTWRMPKSEISTSWFSGLHPDYREQDELGTNTFRCLLEYFQEDILDKPFRDILNLLERLKIIDSADIWLALRELRNDLTHEYPMLVEETIDKLNHLLVQLPVPEKILLTIEQFVENDNQK